MGLALGRDPSEVGAVQGEVRKNCKIALKFDEEVGCFRVRSLCTKPEDAVEYILCTCFSDLIMSIVC